MLFPTIPYSTHYIKTYWEQDSYFSLRVFLLFRYCIPEHTFPVCELKYLYQWFINSKNKGILVAGASLSLQFPLLSLNNLRKISSQLVNGNSAHIADGYECKHTEDHAHALNVFTEGRLPRLKFHESATFVPMMERICYP